MSRRLLRAAIGLVVVAAVGFFFYRSLSSNWAAVGHFDLGTSWALLSTTCFLASTVATGVVWGRLLRRLTGRRWRFLSILRVHLASWLLRYVPGQVSSSVNKFVWGKAHNVPASTMTFAVAYEQAFQLLGALVPGLAVTLAIRATAGGEGLGRWLAVLVPAVAILVIISSRPAMHRPLNALALKFAKRPVAREELLAMRDSLAFQVQYLLPRILLGLAVITIGSQFVDRSLSTAVLIGAAYVTAGAIGVLAVFVPSGLGVRESVFVALVVPVVPLEQAIVIAVTARLLSTVADGIAALLYGGIRAADDRRNRTA